MKYLSIENTRLDGRYDIQSQLGRGSYAEIYVARDIHASPHSEHSIVVIKALNVFLQNDLDLDLERTLVENFQNEAIALDRVRHPNVINRVGHGTARDLRSTIFHYLALEYLSGGDLAKHCRSRSLTLKEALFFLEQVCAGLDFAHRHDVIHRDIKPQNLLLTGDRKIVKIADFGVARITQSDSPITRVGTNIFAPPEHNPMMTGQTGVLKSPRLTPAADIYSLAKTAYVLITGESPRYFANHPITELPFAFRQEIWASELVRILHKATESDSAERHQSVIEFWRDLSQLNELTEVSKSSAAGSVRNISLAPQPIVSKGYSPVAPRKPRFQISRMLHLTPNQSASSIPAPVVRIDSTGNSQPQPSLPSPIGFSGVNIDSKLLAKPDRSKTIRRLAVFAIFIGLFAGALFATQYYIRNGNFFYGVTNPFGYETGTAITDINLRIGPSTDNDPIGLVTKDSKLKIVNKKDTWYEVTVIEQGRPLNGSDGATGGWVFGRYVDINSN